MKEHLRAAAAVLAVMTLLTGVAYPMATTALAKVLFPRQAEGSLITSGGKAVGSELIGQPFARPGYFWGRLSATSPTPYNASASGGSNLGPLNPALVANARGRVDALKEHDAGLEAVPADLATASGSGLDPHISPAAAEAQVRRVAAARGRSEDDVRGLVRRYTEEKQLGLLGEARVNVLRLNLALDGIVADSEGPAGSTSPDRP